jgi:hypothetical protein
MNTAGPEPGWYFDPDGGDHERFWNGEAWTEHRRSKPLTFNPPSQQVSEARPHPRNDERLPLEDAAEAQGCAPDGEVPYEIDPIASGSDQPGSYPFRSQPPDAVMSTAAPTIQLSSPTEAIAAEQESQSDDARTTPRTAPALSLAVIEDLKNKGYSQSEIAEMFGVTRQYVSWIKHTYGGRLTPREVVLQHFPFEVSAEQSQSSPYRRLRDHGEYVTTSGVGMSQDKLKRLRSFYRKLRDGDLVVEFDPNLSPVPGVSSRGGWAFRVRVPEDGDLLIRVNEFTDLTDEGRTIWQFPPQDP